MNDALEFAISLALETGELLQKYYNPGWDTRFIKTR